MADPKQPQNPLDLLLSSQRAAVNLFTQAVSALLDAGRAGVTQPDELLRQVSTLARATGDLAASTARPLEAFLAGQRQLAETMTAFAEAQKQLAELVATAAANHAAIVDALEGVTGPVLGVAELLRRQQDEG